MRSCAASLTATGGTRCSTAWTGTWRASPPTRATSAMRPPARCCAPPTPGARCSWPPAASGCPAADRRAGGPVADPPARRLSARPGQAALQPARLRGVRRARSLYRQSPGRARTHRGQDSPLPLSPPPPLPAHSAHLDAHRSRQVYTVRRGDSLWVIARREWHHAARWPLLWRANHLGNPDALRPGQRLVIPRDPVPSGRLVSAAYAAIPPPPPPAPPPAQPAGPASGPAPAAAPAAEPAAAPAAQPQQQQQAPVTAGGSYQQCVIQAESGGNPAAVNPSTGAGGLYGFLPSTWAALGYGGLPQDASVA